MRNHKTPKADLEGKRIIFLQIGLLLCIFMAITAVNWTTDHKTNIDRVGEPDEIIHVLDLPPITKEPLPEKKKKEKAKEKPKKIDPTRIVIDSLEKVDKIIDTAEVTPVDTTNKIFIPVEPEPEGSIDFVAVQSKPRFLACADVLEEQARACFMKEITSYIAKNTRRPDQLRGISIKGKVFVQFIIDKEGTVQEVEIIRGLNKILDKEVERVVKSMPQFIPGKQRDKNVAVRFILPVSFNYL